MRCLKRRPRKDKTPRDYHGAGRVLRYVATDSKIANRHLAVAFCVAIERLSPNSQVRVADCVTVERLKTYGLVGDVGGLALQFAFAPGFR